MQGPVLRRGIGLALGMAVALGVLAQGAVPNEATLKAGFVYNFGKFTEWPAGALPAANVHVCVTGQDAAGAVVAAIEGRQLQGHALSVRRVSRADDFKSCQIVYVSDPDERRLSEALRAVRNLPILTIGDAEGFTEVGGMIGFGSAAGRITFEINNEAAQAAGLKFSSQLLKLATTVRGRAP